MKETWRREISELARLVAQRRFTQKQLAEETGIDQGQISRILAGRAVRYSKNIATLCAFAQGKRLQKTRSSKDQQRIEKAALDLWDGSPAHAVSIVKALRAIAQLDRGRSK
jgi:transcriptional regulator with XRE-family HTH domain